MTRSGVPQFPGQVAIYLMDRWAEVAKATAVTHELDVPRLHPLLLNGTQEAAEDVAIILLALLRGATRPSPDTINLLDGAAEPASMSLDTSRCTVLPRRNAPLSISLVGRPRQRMSTLKSTS